jgi:hypothetical protein
MKTNAEYEYEYYAFNKEPAFDVEPQYKFYFTEPIRVFAIGPTGLVAAEEWVRETNSMRHDARTRHGIALEIDKAVGSPVLVEVRRRLIIKLGYERIETSETRRLTSKHIEAVGENWVPA